MGPRRDLNFKKSICLFCWYIRVCFYLVVFVREHTWHKALLMGYSMRLEFIRVCNLNDFLLVMGLYRNHHLFFFRVCPALPLIDIWYVLSLCVCVWVLEWFWISLSYFSPMCVCVSMRRRNFVRVCVCVCVVVYFEIYRKLFLSVYIYIYICFQLEAFAKEHVWYKD